MTEQEATDFAFRVGTYYPYKKRNLDLPSFPGRTIAWTDGCSRGNGKTGAVAGYGVFYSFNDPRNMCGPVEGDIQTNQRAELLAINKALTRALSEILKNNKTNPQMLEIRTDSQYARKAFTSWAEAWEKNGYLNSAMEPVRNRDLVEVGRLLIAMLRERMCRVRITHVKGHADDAGNIEADKLANRGATLGMASRGFTTLD